MFRIAMQMLVSTPQKADINKIVKAPLFWSFTTILLLAIMFLQVIIGRMTEASFPLLDLFVSKGYSDYVVFFALIPIATIFYIFFSAFCMLVLGKIITSKWVKITDLVKIYIWSSAPVVFGFIFGIISFYSDRFAPVYSFFFSFFSIVLIMYCFIRSFVIYYRGLSYIYTYKIWKFILHFVTAGTLYVLLYMGIQKIVL